MYAYFYVPCTYTFNECMLLYVPGTYMHIDVYVCMYIVQTRLLTLFSFTSTLHFPSGPISLATPASLSSAQAPLLQPPVISLHVHILHIHCHT